MAGVDASRFRQASSASLRYGDPSYWTARYTASGGTEAYDWYLRWEQLKDILMPVLTPESEPADRSSQVLVLGCGTSTLSEALYGEGFQAVTNVDRCGAVLEVIRKRHQSQLDGGDAAGAKGGKKPPDKGKAASPEPEVPKVAMNFVEGDATCLPQDWAGRFDVVIDKAVLDAVACGVNKWDNVDAMMRSVRHVLKPNSGVYVCMSHAGPEVRLRMLNGPHQDDPSTSEYGWIVSHQTIQRPLVNPTIDPKAKDKFEMIPSASYNAAADVYSIYVCRLSAA